MDRIKILVAKSDNLKCVYRACMIGENHFSYLYTSIMTHVYVYICTHADMHILTKYINKMYF